MEGNAEACQKITPGSRESRCWYTIRDDFRNFFRSEECLRTVQLVEAVA